VIGGDDDEDGDTVFTGTCTKLDCDDPDACPDDQTCYEGMTEGDGTIICCNDDEAGVEDEEGLYCADKCIDDEGNFGDYAFRGQECCGSSAYDSPITCCGEVAYLDTMACCDGSVDPPVLCDTSTDWHCHSDNHMCCWIFETECGDTCCNPAQDCITNDAGDPVCDGPEDRESIEDAIEEKCNEASEEPPFEPYDCPIYV